jgi:hypothetical protein
LNKSAGDPIVTSSRVSNRSALAVVSDAAALANGVTCPTASCVLAAGVIGRMVLTPQQ